MKIAFYTLGCKTNQYETQAMEQLLVEKGHEIGQFSEKLLSSEALAAKMGEIKLSGKSGACFLIGSSFGIAPQIKEKADFKLSMSPMTFPHHLARIMVMEQLYRAEAIQAGSKYHK